MDNRGMMTSLLAIGAAGVAIYGIKKGVENGTFQRLPQNVSNAMSNMVNSQTMQQITQPVQNMMGNQSQNQGTNTEQVPNDQQLQQHVGTTLQD